MIKYALVALVAVLSLAVAFGSYQYVRADRLQGERDDAREEASEARARAEAARFNHAIAIEAMHDAERERDALARNFEQWRKTYVEDLGNPADPALLDLIDSLHGAPGGDPPDSGRGPSAPP